MPCRHVPSKIGRLPAEIREQIAGLRRDGRTIDEIMDKLRELGVPAAEMPSRSGVGRWAKQASAIVDEMRRQREVGEMLVARYGEPGDTRTARVNIGLAQGLLTRLMFTEEGQVATLDAKEAMFLASAISSLATANKADTERDLKLQHQAEKRAMAAAAKAAEAVGRRAGLSADLLDQIKAGIFGKDAV